MRLNKWPVCLATLLLASTFHLNALNVPSTPITVTVVGESPDSFFDATLANVPSGFDVMNNSYLMWCIDLVAPNPPTADGGVHAALLYSTLNGGLPNELAGIAWDKINYIINHKQGTVSDVQHAIWHYTDGFNPDPNLFPVVAQIIADADANGAGFVPGVGQVAAVAVVWQNTERALQLCIIEVPVPNGGCPDRFTSGGFIYRNGKKVTFGIQGGYQNGRLWGGINFVDHGERLHVHSREITSYTVLDENCRRATYAVTIHGQPGVATVRICDNGEPGVNDVMEITLSNGYSAGVGSTIGGDGRGGGNVQLHKPRCEPTKPNGSSKPTRTKPGDQRKQNK
jgi:hypothetical protein